MKSLMLTGALVFAVATATLAAQAPAPAQTPPNAGLTRPAPRTEGEGNTETGKKLYVSVGCYQCHGYEGQGGAAGPRLAPKPMALAAFLRFVRAPPNQMPGYGPRILTDAQLTDIHAFLQARPAPAPVAKIPLLQ